MTYGEKIKKICKEQRVSVTSMEMALGFSNGYIGKLKDKIPTDRAIKIAEYLGLPADYFMPKALKKGSDVQNPLIEEIIIKASNLTEAELQELLSFAGYIQSKHKDS